MELFFQSVLHVHLMSAQTAVLVVSPWLMRNVGVATASIHYVAERVLPMMNKTGSWRQRQHARVLESRRRQVRPPRPRLPSVSFAVSILVAEDRNMERFICLPKFQL